MQDLETEARFKSILAEYSQLLRRAIASHCPHHLGLDYDDILQEAYLKLWRAISDGREIRHFPSYLYRIAATVTIDALRRVKARREEQMQFSPDADEEPDKGHGTQTADTRSSPEITVERQRLLGIVNETLTRFPADRRRAVGLHLQGWNTIEIAGLLGWSEAKARNLVYRGLDELRSRLRAQGINYEFE